MKSPKHAGKAAKLPKPEVMYCFQRITPKGDLCGLLVSDKFQHVVHGGKCFPCLVLPMKTISIAKNAKARIAKPGIAALIKAPSRWEKLSDKKQHAELSDMFSRRGHPVNCDHLATFALQFIKGEIK